VVPEATAFALERQVQSLRPHVRLDCRDGLLRADALTVRCGPGDVGIQYLVPRFGPIWRAG
jgi:hypothetical protein